MKKIDFFYNAFFITPIKFLLPIFNLLIPKMRERAAYFKNGAVSFNHLSNKRKIWFHSSSMGEFEQVKPVIEKIKESHPEIAVICSFYSPSGYNNQKTYQYADSVCYMPFDSLKESKRFVEAMNPDLAVFVRYDLWYNHLNALKKKNIPMYLICATSPRNKLYLSIFKSFIKAIYNKFNNIFTMTPSDTKYFESLKIESNIISSSDSRYDRIITTVNKYLDNPIIAREVFEDYKVLIVGSSWEPDEIIISKAVKLYNQNHKKQIKLIYVPHEPTPKHIEKLSSIEPGLIKYSELEKASSINEFKDLIKNSHIVVDSIGKLLKLYSNADIVYVGGAFGAGIHSVTEPAGFGVPIICGKNYLNSPDAKIMVDKGLLKPINNANELLSYLEYLAENPDKEKSLATKTKDYIFSQGGASKNIANHILKTIFPNGL